MGKIIKMAKNSKEKNVWDYVEWELDVFRQKCNFTNEELLFFNLRAKEKSIVSIGEELHFGHTKTCELSANVKRKISRVLPL